ncbi:MAG: Holliday junction resolvase, partial [Candidatus Parcubacteria bacterium]
MMLLGVDFGSKRIGLATGDTGVNMSFPLRTFENVGDEAAARTVASAARAEGV